MNDKTNNLHQQYQSIKVPKELEVMLKETIKKEKRKKFKAWKNVAAAIIVTSVAFTGACNFSAGFADAIKEIPVINEIARLVTFVDRTEDDGILKVNLLVPAVEGLGDEALALKINNAINEKVNTHVEEAKIRAKEYKEAFVETGGNPDDFHDLSLDVTYEVLCQSGDVFSFKLSLIESMATVYSAEQYYSIDLTNNKTLKLEDLLGENYQAMIADQVKNQIHEMTEDEQSMFFMEDVEKLKIDEDQVFYLNENEEIVVVFDKYEIACGAAGKQKFIIHK